MEKFLDTNSVIERWNISRSQFYRLRRLAEDFPLPVYLGKSSPRYRLSDIEAFEKSHQMCNSGLEVSCH